MISPAIEMEGLTKFSVVYPARSPHEEDTNVWSPSPGCLIDSHEPFSRYELAEGPVGIEPRTPGLIIRDSRNRPLWPAYIDREATWRARWDSNPRLPD